MSRSVSMSRGAVISVTMRWTDRLVGLLSTIILARLLVPDDFGIIAMASVVVGLIDVILNLGVHVALIQNNEAEQSHYDTAWTLGVIQAFISTILLYLSAPFVADYYHDPRVILVLQVMAASVLIGGFTNIGVVDFQKNMEFGMDFRFFFYKRLLSFIVTIGAASLLHSYWALVIGSMTGKIIGVGLSYSMHSMRPKFSLARFNDIFSISQWILVKNIGSYLDNKMDKLFIGNRATATTLGAYTLADEIASLPSTELLAPLSRVLFPAFVKVKHDLQALKRAYLLALGVQTLVGIPAGVGLALVAKELVIVLLGQKWTAAIPFLQVIGFINIIWAIGASGSYVLLALGKVKIIALYVWIQAVLFITLVMVVMPHGDAMTIALSRLAVAFFGLISFAILLKLEITCLKFRDMIMEIWRPVVAVIIMFICVISLNLPINWPVGFILTTKIIIGALSYTASLLVVWLLSGSQDGAERYLLDKILHFVQHNLK